MKRQPVRADDLRARIRAAGLRCTTARLAVLDRLARASRPLTHAEVADQLASSGFDRATIYRNLVELAEAGLAERVELGDRVWRFELKRAGHAHSNEHPHFVCVDCGEVFCLATESVKITSRPGKSFRPQITEVLLKGHCGQCS